MGDGQPTQDGLASSMMDFGGATGGVEQGPSTCASSGLVLVGASGLQVPLAAGYLVSLGRDSRWRWADWASGQVWWGQRRELGQCHWAVSACGDVCGYRARCGTFHAWGRLAQWARTVTVAGRNAIVPWPAEWQTVEALLGYTAS